MPTRSIAFSSWRRDLVGVTLVLGFGKDEKRPGENVRFIIPMAITIPVYGLTPDPDRVRLAGDRISCARIGQTLTKIRVYPTQIMILNSSIPCPGTDQDRVPYSGLGPGMFF